MPERMPNPRINRPFPTQVSGFGVRGLVPIDYWSVNAPSVCDHSHLEAPPDVLAPICTILAMVTSNLVLGWSTLVVFLYLVAGDSFWRRIVHLGGNHLFGCLIGSL